MGNPVTTFEIAGKDPEALRRFYAEAFGWRMGTVRSSYAMAHPDGGHGIDGVVSPAQRGNGYAIFYVEVDDLATTLAKVEALGGKRVTDPVDVPGGPTIALFTDPEAHLVGLVKARVAVPQE